MSAATPPPEPISATVSFVNVGGTYTAVGADALLAYGMSIDINQTQVASPNDNVILFFVINIDRSKADMRAVTVTFTSVPNPLCGAGCRPDPVNRQFLRVSSSTGTPGDPSFVETVIGLNGAPLTWTAAAGQTAQAIQASMTSPAGQGSTFENAATVTVTFIPLSQDSLDLAVGTPAIVADDGSALPSPQGLPLVTPGEHALLNLPVSAQGFNAARDGQKSATFLVTDESGTTVGTYGPLTLSEIHFLGTSGIPIPIGIAIPIIESAGVHTITAKLIPEPSIQEIDSGHDLNNSASVRVQVANPYKLGLVVNGVPVADSGGTLTLQPSVNACGALPTSTPGATAVTVQCLNANDNTVSTTGCQNFILDLSLGQNNGGHSHNENDETRPFVFGPNESTFPTGSYQSFGSDGTALLAYTPPEVAGDVILDVAGTDVGGSVIKGPSFKFVIQDTSLGGFDPNS
ncbi:MAG: hypothetical protein HY075_11170 [Deltaproteobacteria bacterium]|nr:hypothetical protein [Deltaproteobacteria bacterium]